MRCQAIIALGRLVRAVNVPHRQIRPVFTERSITVYQACNASIATPAVAAQRFVAPFKRERMTWIKPSFLDDVPLWLRHEARSGAGAGDRGEP
ncbi:hypothetical protein GCM10027203_67750 [Nonomuraea fastidiosa]|jgi:hypothetical protein